MKLSYADAESILASLFIAQDVQRRAFRGRLKHLKRLGIPLGSSPGKGAKVNYSMDDLYQWTFCLHLADFGIDPTSIVAFVQRHWQSSISRQFHDALLNDPKRETYFISHPSLMSAKWCDNEELTHRFVDREDIAAAAHCFSRTIVINMVYVKKSLLKAVLK